MSHRELNAVVPPGGKIQLEWSRRTTALDKSAVALQAEIEEQFNSGTGSWLLILGFADPAVTLSDSLRFFREFAALFTAKLLRTPDTEALREGDDIALEADRARACLESAPLMTGAENLTEAFLADLWQALNRELRRAIAAHSGSVADLIRTYRPQAHLIGRVFFHLVESKDPKRPFAFMATYSTRVDRTGRSKHVPLKYALKEFEGRQEQLLELLSTVYRAARDSTVAADLLQTGEIFHPLAWPVNRAFTFLKDIPIFETAGILCRIPNWWKASSRGVGISVSFGDKKPSLLGMKAILNVNFGLLIGGETLTRAEAEKLLQQSEGLAYIKNKWVAVDSEKLQKTLAAYDRARRSMSRDGLSIKEALQLQLNPQRLAATIDADIDLGVKNGKWLAGVLDKLRDPNRIAATTPGNRFKAKLRPYQRKGLNWLYFLHTLGFGVCLADDMGLGKTVQVLAFLNRLKTEATRTKQTPTASLLVVPASLMANWAQEIDRFAPCLSILVAHPGEFSGGNLEAAFKDRPAELDRYDLVITTYGLACRYTWLQNRRWRYLILDEAQAIKNPATKQTKALKAYQADNRIILTGTPVENRLSDLWSLFDFVNPGLLGNVAEFKHFVKGLKEDPGGYARLRRLISPYILRRLKTDKTIIADLPDKVEMKTYATLSRKQVLLYQKMVSEIEKMIEDEEGMRRRGLILSSLMKFKQLCNHPDQYLGTGGYAENESGKFLRLREICETIYAKRERVLVFTQFKELTEPLAAFLETIFERPGVVLHGAVAVKKRKSLVARFQAAHYVPFMVLSIKAGGVGLNLTAANHVIHFDRWWNPAVENQATDRAFRIGQQKNVVVHKFVTKGTVEEKIDEMLVAKTKLADDVIGATGEAWITEMDNHELRNLFSLTL